MDFTAPAKHREKLKESEKKPKYQDLSRELQNWNKKVTVIPILIGALGRVTKDWYRDWWTWRLENEVRPSNLQHCRDWSEYWEES